MFKIFSRYLREHLERRVINQKEKVDNATKKQQSCYCKCDNSFFSDYLEKINKHCGCKYAVLSVKEQTYRERKYDAFTTSNYLKESWIEALGWSGTLAFGWAISQNFHRFRRRKSAEDFLKYYHFQPYGIPRKNLCPHQIVKSVLVQNVLAQPDDFAEVKSLTDSKKVDTSTTKLPVFGPKTAEEALNEVSEGLKKAHNEAIGELENRLGLQCMSSKRYKKAVIHFAAGSALQNGSAAFNLAQCYELGLGISQDFVKAAKFYHQASDLGNASATYNLAVFYAHGYGGLKSDRCKALQLLEKATQLGDANAQKLLQQFLVNSKPAFTKNTEPELNKAVDDAKGEVIVKATSPVPKPNFTVFQLPVAKIRDDTVTTNKDCNSISVDDSLPSDLESSVSSADSHFDLDYSHDSSVEQSSGEEYESSNPDDVNYKNTNFQFVSVSKRLKKHVSSEYRYPIPILTDIYRWTTVPRQ